MPDTPVIVAGAIAVLLVLYFILRPGKKAEPAKVEAKAQEPAPPKAEAKKATAKTPEPTAEAPKAKSEPPPAPPEKEEPKEEPAAEAPRPPVTSTAKTPDGDFPPPGKEAEPEPISVGAPESEAPAAVVEEKKPTVPPPPVAPPKMAAPPPPRRPLRSYSNISDESVAAEESDDLDVAKVETPKPAAEVKPAPPAPKPAPPAPKPAAAAPPAPKPAPPKPVEAKPAPAAKAEEHDFSALDEPAPAKAEDKPAPATPARFVPPSNPETAELEKSDPRHAAARRLARVSVSEIKLYHEDEVKAGRESGDLWKRLQQDIALATQTFEARVAADVRERFDYLYDEVLRQLAEGDAAKLGPEAPKPKGKAAAAPAPAAPAPRAPADSVSDAPTSTALKTVPEAAPTTPAVVPSIARPEPKAAPAPAAAIPKPEPVKAAPAAAAPAATPAAAKPTGLAARALPSNPETAELEKSDPRHAAARRLARLSVSEIKLYHEDEVKAGREAKDLWKRLSVDIGLAVQTFDKRVDKEVRERFDYLYDEILRQLAEGDAAKLGPEAPKPKKADAPEPEVPKAEAAPAPAAPAPAAAAARFAPPSNPETAELEKSDPRHAAARRLARLSVSEIKLYHEDEVKAGREAKDLWKRLSVDIGLAVQTFDKRVDKEVRERFDYLYDEILRQLAEGDAAKLGPEAPKPKSP